MAGGRKRATPTQPSSSASLSHHDARAAKRRSVETIYSQYNMLPSPAPTETSGARAWRQDYEACQARWGGKGEVEGFVGMIATITGLEMVNDHTLSLRLEYEDADGRECSLNLQIAFGDMDAYPSRYTTHITSSSTLPRRAKSTFSRFALVYDQDLETFFTSLISALQGDEDASGGEPPGEESGDVGFTPLDEENLMPEAPGRGFETAAGGLGDMRSDWALVKEHLAQGKRMGYRPGLTNVSYMLMFSYSIPFKNLPIDPNILATWDDGLVSAWRTDQRLTLLMGMDRYPPGPDGMRFWLGMHPSYKPPLDTMTATVRNQPGPLPHFFMSRPLLTQLKAWLRCYKLRTAFGVDWDTADSIGLDEQRSHSVFTDQVVPAVSPGAFKVEDGDPVAGGWGSNLPLVAFWWVLRRFCSASRFCLNCGLEVEKVSLRPYVCSKPLCLYGFMSLGLGPSVEHVIQTHPGVVDLLLSFAHAAASTSTRMDLPLHLHIEVPPEFTPVISSKAEVPSQFDTAEGKLALLDSLPDHAQRQALVYLIDQLPSVSTIKTQLDAGLPLKSIEAPPGSIGVLRWVVGSCRAYLKEVKPGQGVLNDMSARTDYYYGGASSNEPCRQFAFVVGSPEQEANFRDEVDKAQQVDENCKTYPTLLAFHGSGLERWHNILRTGLDFSETANGRAYGHGVYFAAEASTSMSGYARSCSTLRKNADFQVIKATALVELVNVPKTFVSSNPFYVVGNVKQIKPFLLLVHGRERPPAEDATNDMAAPSPIRATSPSSEGEGQLFKHDPALALKTTFFHQLLKLRMPDKLVRMAYIDNEPDDEDEFLRDMPTATSPSPPELQRFEPSPPERFARLQLMPPPSDTSVSATRALRKEFKAVVHAQERGELPFWINPDTDSLYCWTIEMFEWPKSGLRGDMDRFGVKSVVAEIRFPATFPMSPPFMRILHPRCLPFTAGGGGNITGGGSVCNEILTASGWNPAFCVEAIVRDIMANMTEATPPARLDPSRWDQPYTMAEAIEAFKRVAGQHGWEVPRDFDKMTR